jgi:hypothetical protein
MVARFVAGSPSTIAVCSQSAFGARKGHRTGEVLQRLEAFLAPLKAHAPWACGRMEVVQAGRHRPHYGQVGRSS